MKRWIGWLAFPLLLSADVVSPSLEVESRPVTMSAPQRGAPVMAIPGSTAWVWFEDMLWLGDKDYNDAVFKVEFKLKPGNSEQVEGEVERIGGIAGYHLSLWGPFHIVAPIGSEVVMGIKVQELDKIFKTGDYTRNWDQNYHAWVEQTTPPSAVPEPSSVFLSGIGLLILGWKLRMK